MTKELKEQLREEFWDFSQPKQILGGTDFSSNMQAIKYESRTIGEVWQWIENKLEQVEKEVNDYHLNHQDQPEQKQMNEKEAATRLRKWIASQFLHEGTT